MQRWSSTSTISTCYLATNDEESRANRVRDTRNPFFFCETTRWGTKTLGNRCATPFSTWRSSTLRTNTTESYGCSLQLASASAAANRSPQDTKRHKFRPLRYSYQVPGSVRLLPTCTDCLYRYQKGEGKSPTHHLPEGSSLREPEPHCRPFGQNACIMILYCTCRVSLQ